MLSSLKNAARFSLSLALLQLTFFSLLLLAFFWKAPSPETTVSWLYFITLPSYYYVVICLIILLFSPFTLFIKSRPLLLVPLLGIQCYFVVDIFVFDVYRFHINQMLIDMFIFDLKGIGIPGSILAIGGAALVLLIALNVYLLKLSQRFTHNIALWALPLILTLFIFNQLIHIWGFSFNQRTITQYTIYMPLYQPFLSSEIASDIETYFPSWVPEQSEGDEFLSSDQFNKGTLNYPRTELLCKPEEVQHNILIFTLESWRSGMMDATITPNIYQFAQQSYQFNNHLSGGNVTITGLFTLLYGLHPSYLKEVQGAPLNYKSVLNRTLHAHNYQSEVYTSSDLSRFAMRPMFFAGIKDEQYHFIHQQGSVEANDKQVIKTLIKNISDDKSGDNPWYRFAFLTSSHYSYTYPQEHELFTPVGDPGDFIFNKFIDSEPYLNDYKNSLHYLDSLFAETLDALKKSGQLDNTIIILTGDHGEEFNDHGLGYWGHGSNFTRVQTSAPLIIRMPGQPQGEQISQRSAHIDIAPTLLRHGLNCEGDYSGISNGEDLFNLPDSRPLMSASYTNRAYIVDDAVYVEEIGIKSYNIDDLNNKDLEVPYDQIRMLMDQAQYFMDH